MIEKLLAVEMHKSKVFTNWWFYLGLSILEISGTMYEFWYVFIKLEHEEKAKIGYMDTVSIIVQIKTEDIYPDSGKDVEARFDTSNYELGRPLPKGKSKKK